MAELQRDSPLFDDSLTVSLRSNGNSRLLSLIVRIIPGLRALAQGGHSEKLFHFEVTDESDPYFLYLLDVGEGDFHALKTAQNIHVEFAVFPTKFIDLLKLCATTSPTQNGQASRVSGFFCELNTENGKLSVAELNGFKTTIQIELQLIPGNDSAIKSYLASRLNFITNIARCTADELNATQHELSAQQSRFATTNDELQELKRAREIDVKTIESNFSQELTQCQLQSSASLEEARKRFDAQQDVMRASLEALHRESQTRNGGLEQTIADLTHSKSQLELKLRDTTRQLDSASSERDRLQADWQEACNQRRILEDSRSSSERDAARLGARVEAYIQQLQDKDESMAKTVALCQASEDARAALEEKLCMFITTSESLEDKLRECSAEIAHGNNIMSRFQAENKSLKEKIRDKTEVIRRQEATVNRLQSRVQDLDQQVLVSKDMTASVKNQCASLERQLEEAHGIIAKNEELLESNKKVITYLNEENNRWQLGFTEPPARADGNMAHSQQYQFSSPPSTSGKYSRGGAAGGATDGPWSSAYNKHVSVISLSPDSVADGIAFNAAASSRNTAPSASIATGLRSHSRADVGSGVAKSAFATESHNASSRAKSLDDDIILRGILGETFSDLGDVTGVQALYGKSLRHRGASGRSSNEQSGVEISSLGFYATTDAPPPPPPTVAAHAGTSSGRTSSSSGRARSSPQGFPIIATRQHNDVDDHSPAGGDDLLASAGGVKYAWQHQDWLSSSSD